MAFSVSAPAEGYTWSNVVLYLAAALLFLRFWRGVVGWVIARVLLALARIDAAPSVVLTAPAIRAMARVFGDSVDLSRVVIRPGVGWPLDLIGRAYAIENTIFLLPEEVLDKATLVHELTHVWQHQNGGDAYIAESLIAQALGNAYDLGRGLGAGCEWEELNCEQQAVLVQYAWEQGWFKQGGGRRAARRFVTDDGASWVWARLRLA